jgi:hypothetical protein
VLLILAVTGVSEGAVINLDASPDTVIADGISQVNISAQLLGGRYNNTPLASKTITFLTTDGVILTPRVNTDSNGWAYTSLTSSTKPGQVTITAGISTLSASTKVMFTECGAECNVSYTPEGIYSLLDSDIPTASILGNQYVKGISVRSSWDSIEHMEGSFDWSRIDNLVSQAEIAGKKVSIAIAPGVNTPEWVYAKGARKFYFIDRNPYHPTYGHELYCPMPWDDVYLISWINFIEALASRYGKNPTVSWIRTTGPMNTVTMDWNLQEKEDWDKYIGTGDEFSDEKLVGAIKKVIDSFAVAFPSKPLSLAIAKTKITDKSPFLTAATEVTNYGFSNYPNQFLIQINRWKATILPDGPNLTLLYAPFTGAQMVWSATNDPDCRMNGKVTPCDPYTSLEGAIQAAIDYNLSFLEIYAVDIMNPDLQPILTSFDNNLTLP